MAKHQWRQELSVGHDAIDDDHRHLFELLAELESRDLSGGFPADVIARLEDYAEHHFAREEELMRRVEYPDYDAHVAKHRLFIEWLETVKATYRRAAESPYEIGEMVNDFLGRWLTEHIEHEDMKYRDFILSRRARTQ